MIAYFTANVWLIWVLISVLCLLIELTAGDLDLLCVAIGGLCAAVASALGANWVVQILVLVVCSLLCILFLRPVALRWLHKNDVDAVSNADAILGRTGTVSETIEANGYGRVALDGDDWKAQAADAQQIAQGEKVKIVGRESIIVTVERI